MLKEKKMLQKNLERSEVGTYFELLRSCSCGLCGCPCHTTTSPSITLDRTNSTSYAKGYAAATGG